jgi:hypothetical protein
MREDGKIVGVCVFTKFSRLQAQNKYKNQLELARLCISQAQTKNAASMLIGHCLRKIKSFELYAGIVSYADTTEGHQGIVYKACNFKIIGETKKSYHYMDGEKRVHKKKIWDISRENKTTEKETANIKQKVKNII